MSSSTSAINIFSKTSLLLFLLTFCFYFGIKNAGIAAVELGETVGQEEGNQQQTSAAVAVAVEAEEGSSSAVNKEDESIRAEGSDGNGRGGEKGKILFLADGLGTHYQFALNMVNMLLNNNYDVDFVTVHYDQTRTLTPPSSSGKGKLKFITVPFGEEFDDKLAVMVGKMAWGTVAPPHVRENGMMEMLKYQMFTFYEAIIRNPAVYISEAEGNQPIFSWLKSQVPYYQLGMSEVCISAGTLPVFHELGLAKYIVTSAASPFPVFLHLLGQTMAATVPERFTPQPGDGNNETKIRENQSDRQERNIGEYKESIPKFLKIYHGKVWEELLEKARRVKAENVEFSMEKMPTIGELLRRARFFLVNQHQIANFPVELTTDRIRFIGGIEVEAKGVIARKYAGGHAEKVDKNWIEKDDQFIETAECLVVFSLGTVVKYKGFTEEHAHVLYQAMAKHEHCQFLVRIDLDAIPKEIQKLASAKGSNVHFRSDKNLIKQQQILAQKNVRAIVIHCGQNSLNEALYAGVPIICLTFFGDQPYNAVLVEYMGVGIWIPQPKFLDEFPKAMDKIMLPNTEGKRNFYAEMAEKFGQAIHAKENRQRQTRHFLAAVREAVNEKLSVGPPQFSTVFPPVPGGVEPRHVELLEFSTVLDQFMTPVYLTGTHNLIYTAFPERLHRHQYKFDGIFDDFRIEMLQDIVAKGGSVQSNDVLEYAEYQKRDNVEFPEHLRLHYQKIVYSLVAKIEQFSLAHSQAEHFSLPYLDKAFQRESKSRLELIRTSEGHKPDAKLFNAKKWPTHQLVMDCKEFMQEVLSEGGEGSWLDVYSFMRQKTIFYKIFSDIFELSKWQSPSMDNWVNEWIYQQHWKNQPKHVPKSKGQGQKPVRRVVVEGAGPIGLYAAYQFFAAGMHVTLVNDRAEGYLRNHMIFLDAKWMAQLRLFMGTFFDECFIGKQALGQINAPVEVGQLNMMNFQDFMKERLVLLAKYVEHRSGSKKKLEILYETTLQKVDFPTDNNKQEFYAVLGQPEKQFDPFQQKFTENYVQNKESMMNEQLTEFDLNAFATGTRSTKLQDAMERTNKFLTEHHGRDVGDDEAIIPYTKGRGRAEQLITPREHAELKMQGKAFPLKKYPKLAFDLLVCAGGANDQVRNEYLGDPEQLTVPKDYGTVIFVKEKFGEYIFKDETFFYKEKMTKMEPFLKEQRFGEFIAQHKFLPETIRQRYANLEEMIVKGLQKDGGNTRPNGQQLFKRDAKGHFLLGSKQTPLMFVRLFENKPTLHIASITPLAIEELLREVEEERKAREKVLKETEAKLEKTIKMHLELKENKGKETLDAKEKPENAKSEVEKQKELLEHHLREEIEKLEKEIENFYDFRYRFERKWSATIFHFSLFLAHPERVGQYVLNMNGDGKEMLTNADRKVLAKLDANARGQLLDHHRIPPRAHLVHFDEQPFNTSTFTVTIHAAMEPLKQLESKQSLLEQSIDGAAGHSKSSKKQEEIGVPLALMAAVGDANTSAHFMTASGLSTGRMGVELAAQRIKDYNLGKGQFTSIANDETKEDALAKLKEMLGKQLKSLKYRVLRKVLEYVDPLPKWALAEHPQQQQQQKAIDEQTMVVEVQKEEKEGKEEEVDHNRTSG